MAFIGPFVKAQGHKTIGFESSPTYTRIPKLKRLNERFFQLLCLMLCFHRPRPSRIGLIVDGSRIQLGAPAICGDLWRPAATCGDRMRTIRFGLLVMEVVGKYQAGLIFATTIKATSRVTGGQCKFLCASPEVMPKYGGRSLVGFCGNYT